MFSFQFCIFVCISTWLLWCSLKKLLVSLFIRIFQVYGLQIAHFLYFFLSFRTEDGKPAEMFDNPLYGSREKTRSGRDQESSRKDHLPPPEIFAFPKATDAPVPTPRNRSFTCSDSKPQNLSSAQTPSSSSSGSNSNSNNLLPLTKKPVVPSRSEGGMVMSSRPPLPSKFRPGQPLDLQPQPKPRDYRDSSELPGKIRLPTRPSQPLPKDGTIQRIELVATKGFLK